MNVFSRLARASSRLWKAIPRFPSWSGQGGSDVGFGQLAAELERIMRSREREVDYAKIDPALNSVVEGCLSTVTMASADSRLRLMDETGPDGRPVEVTDHPAAALLAHPNDDLSTGELLSATRVDLQRRNAYWWLSRDRAGDPDGIWYLPRELVRARWPVDGSELISHYELWTGTGWQHLAKRDVLHFRGGRPDFSPGLEGRYARDPLKALLREIAVDDRASDWAAVLLENQAVAGYIMTPKETVNLSREEIKARIAEFQKNYTGRNRGRLALLTMAFDVKRMGFNPDEMDFSALTRRSEARICGALNVPASIAGTEIGLENSNARANAHEDTRRLWELNLLPVEGWILDKLNHQLLPEFEPRGYYYEFDHSAVQALRSDQKQLAEIAVRLFGGGIVSRRRAQEIAEQPVDMETPDVYALAGGVTLYEVGTLPAAPEPFALPPAPERRALPPAPDTTKAADPLDADWDTVRTTLGALDVPGLSELLDPEGE